MAIQDPPSRSQHKTRRNVWIAVGAIGGTLILILIVIVTVLVVSSNRPATSTAPATKETPQEGLTAYATDLQHGNYHEAYQHLSTNYTLQLNTNPKTEAAYTATESAEINPRGGIKTFTISTLFLVDVGNGSTNSGAKGSLDYIFADGSTTRVFFLLTLENNHWKILSETYQVKAVENAFEGDAISELTAHGETCVTHSRELWISFTVRKQQRIASTT